jgi:hypothetical protein
MNVYSTTLQWIYQRDMFANYLAFLSQYSLDLEVMLKIFKVSVVVRGYRSLHNSSSILYWENGGGDLSSVVISLVD